MNKAFDKIFNLRPRKSAFNLSYEKKMTLDMGQLIPIVGDMAIPGDIWSIGNAAVLRFQPLLAPILHRIKIRTYYFFVPLRTIWDDFETFITRGEDGTSEPTIPLFNPQDATTPADVIAEGTLWDYFGFPTGINPPEEVCPTDFLRRAYLNVYNEYFRDQTLMNELDITDIENYSILNRCWDKDYFTSSLPFQLRGTPPALPVFGTASAEFTIPLQSGAAEFDEMKVLGQSFAPGASTTGMWAGYEVRGTSPVHVSGNTSAGSDTIITRFNDNLSDNNTIDGSTFTSVDIADLRLANQLQVFLERNARSGGRYLEQLQARFGISPKDSRLQRPEWIGGTSSDVVISEVLQTSATASEPTPQGNLAGHGIGVQAAEVGKYRVEEYGIILGIMCVSPVPAYQDGINRQWLTRTNYDFFAPEFANLSEQEIYNAEVCVKDRSVDTDGSYGLGVFGYTGIYNEHRYKPSMVCGQMRDTFDYWHLGRQFDPASPPVLDDAFVEMDPANLKRIFAAPSEPGIIASVGNRLDVLRPMPIIAEPMLGGPR